MIRYFLAALLALISVPASAQLGPPGFVPLLPMLPLTQYVGPGNVLPGATAWYGLRGYNSGFAAPGNNTAIMVRRASNNAVANIVILTNGNLDIATANAFAGTDATCTSGTAAASTTLSLTGCSSTPTAGDTLTSTGGSGSFSQPVYIVSCGSFAGGAGSCTLNTAQTVTGVTVTAQVALFVREIFDQSGNGVHLTQTTNSQQPQLLPSCLNSLPCMNFNGANSQILVNATTCAGTGIPWFAAAVATSLSNNQGGTSGGGNIFQLCIDNNNHENRLAFSQAGNVFVAANGVAGSGATASISVAHAMSAFSPFFGNLGSFLVDGTFTSANASAIGQAWNGPPGPSTGPGAALGGDNFAVPNQFVTAYIMEAGSWQIPATQNQQTNICANQNTYWFTGSLSCTAVAPTAYTAVTGPCDLISCAEAWSVTRALTNNYTGPLLQLWNGTNVLDIGQNTTTRAADMTTWSAFCSGVASSCKIVRIYSQIHNSNNDLVPNNFFSNANVGPANCAGSYTQCAVTFAIEAATGLPVINMIVGTEYTANTLSGGGGAGPGGYGDDSQLVGINGGQNPLTIILNGNWLGTTMACCGTFGVLQKYTFDSSRSGTDFSIDVDPSNFSLGIDAANLNPPLGGPPCPSGDGAVVPGAPFNIVAFMDTTLGSTQTDMYYNGHTLFQHNPPLCGINLVFGTNEHLGGGGDMTNPANVTWREGIIANYVLSATERANVFSNNTAFYSGLSFP